ncbi:hypothetical protein HOLleu_20200 [Holothuria leucospilota]|uniref:Uncharacterized protein n=1 Tax=Holothuria leucospilota TaxID=206669 RepID=A0A9Q1C198_HOLLE|nr:hypothetical protein HOLleu_20200 [Holothuria leucospilota]
MRIGRVTASRVHPVLQTDFENPAPSVIKSICMPPCNISHLPVIQWVKLRKQRQPITILCITVRLMRYK